MSTRPYPPDPQGQASGFRLQEIRLSLVRESHPLPPPMRSAADLVQWLQPHFQHEHREVLLAVPLNTRHQPLGIHMVSVGTPEFALMHPREVFLAAILAGASALLVAHNHPSGDPAPSAEDRNVTDRLRRSGQILGIELLDHIVLGTGRFYSFADDRCHPVQGTPAP